MSHKLFHPIIQLAKILLALTCSLTLMFASFIPSNADSGKRLAQIKPQAIITVNSLSDIASDNAAGGCSNTTPVPNNPCTLRAAIAYADDSAGFAAIDFDVNGTINLINGTLQIPDLQGSNISINGAGQSIAIDGGGSVQVMKIGTQANVTLKNLTIQHGHTDGDGGGITNQGALTVINCTFTGNSASGNGGAIMSVSGYILVALGYNAATLYIENSTFVNNSAGDAGGGWRRTCTRRRAGRR